MSFATSSRATVTELLKFAIFTIILWSLSVTVLLPVVILLNKWSRLREKFFLVTWMLFGLSEKTLRPLRKIFFEILKNDIPDFKDKTMNIVELGVGLCANLQFYSKNHKITFICKNKEFFPYVQKTLKKHKNIDVDNTLLCNLEQLNDVLDSSVDIVISNLCLCSVLDVDAFLIEVKRVLKKGGTFAFLEHVGFPEDRYEYVLQMLATKFWKVFTDGCCLDRHITNNLKKARFSTITYTTYYPQSQLLCMRPTVIGFCTK